MGAAVIAPDSYSRRKPDNCPWGCGTTCNFHGGGTGLICKVYCNGKKIYKQCDSSYNKKCWLVLKHVKVATKLFTRFRNKVRSLLMPPLSSTNAFIYAGVHVHTHTHTHTQRISLCCQR